MQSLAPGASLSSELLSQRTTTAEDYAAYTGLREPQEEEMERYEKGHEALSLTSTLHSPVRGRKVSRWDSEGRGRPYQDPSEENSNGETNCGVLFDFKRCRQVVETTERFKNKCSEDCDEYAVGSRVWAFGRVSGCFLWCLYTTICDLGF
ncbi:hypothetical protein TGME49_255195 [Toxoplasma gondii ME49]|uniref:Uncharacterized protein n=2 Tax=Toxoplasma gondii TaxID=5811 RepID=A0A125YPB6_TOXGV|nr:hypothetical protein TGME49_255195 [Toxoplasma gondii ME49]EPT29131.1 hypothetical protein TGME49_255195 [Toxoplasma gondii ME49]ESS35474.1 hypothetical protein TGVEG_255195 [Toxoplasma gondii VEG]|eukprot:XP_018636925.1 hypothetical protein TGME49_255195 [Toxoplasma gondii ME49]